MRAGLSGAHQRQPPSPCIQAPPRKAHHKICGGRDEKVTEVRDDKEKTDGRGGELMTADVVVQDRGNRRGEKEITGRVSAAWKSPSLEEVLQANDALVAKDNHFYFPHLHGRCFRDGVGQKETSN